MSVQILKGDCREILPTLAAESVHCVVTSPPYWGLRDYGTAKWDGGDDLECDHIEVQPQGRTGRETPGGRGGTFPHTERAFKEECRKCGAVRIDRQIGLEANYQDFVAQMVAVFREVRRALRGDGTLWLNLGDSYAGGSIANSTRPGNPDKNGGASNRNGLGAVSGLKPKDLCGIPWRVAFALQADGWWLRQDIIWSKPNPMPESVTDRCTKAHEYMFLLTKSERYYFDQEGIAEPAVRAGLVLHSYGTGAKDRADVSETNDRRTRIGLANWNQAQPDTRNKRSVWEVCTAPYAEAHFATFPPALIEPCILAGCPKGGTVLDPFGGAGTTGLVADRLGRNAILIELNPDYAAMAERRLRQDAGMFAEVT